MKRKIGLTLQQQIINNYQTGLSTHKVGKLLSISPSSVFGILKRRSIPLRKQYDYEYSKYKFRRNFFKKIDSPIKAYWLGVLLADGRDSIKFEEFIILFIITTK